MLILWRNDICKPFESDICGRVDCQANFTDRHRNPDIRFFLSAGPYTFCLFPHYYHPYCSGLIVIWWHICKPVVSWKVGRAKYKLIENADWEQCNTGERHQFEKGMRDLNASGWLRSKRELYFYSLFSILLLC